MCYGSERSPFNFGLDCFPWFLKKNNSWWIQSSIFRELEVSVLLRSKLLSGSTLFKNGYTRTLVSLGGGIHTTECHSSNQFSMKSRGRVENDLKKLHFGIDLNKRVRMFFIFHFLNLARWVVSLSRRMWCTSAQSRKWRALILLNLASTLCT